MNIPKRKIDIDVLKNSGWVLLDEYELSEEENKVTLSDKGIKGQRLIADVVKWKQNKK